MRVLVVEDEKKVAKALREGLEAEHYDVRVASSGEEGFFLVNHEAFDCVVLDLMLSQRDGLEVLTTLRKRGLPTPVLILTAFWFLPALIGAPIILLCCGSTRWSLPIA